MAATRTAHPSSVNKNSHKLKLARRGRSGSAALSSIL
jgi:hypothetical protein